MKPDTTPGANVKHSAATVITAVLWLKAHHHLGQNQRKALRALFALETGASQTSPSIAGTTERSLVERGLVQKHSVKCFLELTTSGRAWALANYAFVKYVRTQLGQTSSLAVVEGS
jgi:hypothetical protein